MNKTVIDFPEVNNILNDDVLYLLRGVGIGRDKKVKTSLLFLTDVFISTQAEFEKYFGTGTETGTGQTVGGWDYSESGGDVIVTIPVKTNIFLKSDPSDGVITHFKYNAVNFPYKAYELKTKIMLQTSVSIQGEGIDQTIVARKSDDDYPVFVTTYVHQEAVTGVTGNDFTVADSSKFQPGQTIRHSIDTSWYLVISVPDATSVIVDKTITGAVAGSLYLGQDSIETKDFTFDGRCGINGLGGTRFGEGVKLENCIYSNFEAKIINCKTYRGGGYNGNFTTFSLKIKNIYHCITTNGAGGGVARVHYSEISHIYNCTTSPTDGGGGCGECDFCNIHDIYSCHGSCGGACCNCDNSKISNIYNCSCIETTYTAGGGACCNCDNSKISNIYNCSCESTSGGAQGGACYGCDNSKISNIYNCSCKSTTGTTAGGGCYSCDNGTISDIHNCSVNNDDNDAVGGAAAACDKVCILGNFTGNTDDPGGGGGTDTFSAMTNYCNNFMYDGAAAQTANAGPTNFD